MHDDQKTNIEVLSRIIVLETRLANTIEKLDKLIDVVERRHNLLAGDETTPSITSRIISLEQTKKTVGWYLASIYTALLGLIVSYIKDKL